MATPERQAARRRPHPFTTAPALTEAMAALGIEGIWFEPVAGDPWRIGMSHDLPLDQLVRLLLANLSAAHLHRQRQAVLLDELAELVAQGAQPVDERVGAILGELRELVRGALVERAPC